MAERDNYDTFCHGDAKTSDRVSNVAGRSNTVLGRTANVTELEWTEEIVECDVVHRDMILRERSITVNTYVHVTTRQDQFPHYIVYGRSENVADRHRT